ncbi:MIF-like protein mif-2 [Homarus americanus]|uniref:MIF-like protein mif-2-like n=1 Tax=Homarus americanus TaxID=6706 RepID=A0A8J5N442_HOMAM|nr:MIF-like protein mif-2 [Homarus americanus]KAG7173032.1 MIF-like protein mif-2-like [Homarus americanus]
MPFVFLRTNLPDEKLSKEFHLQLAAKVGEALGKSVEKVSLTIETNLRMTRGTSFDPLCELHICSIGLSTREQTVPLTKTMTEFLEEHTGIPRSKLIMSFMPILPHLVAINGHVVQ